MKIQYLGTAAAEGIPAIFCECATCRKSRELGGKNIRTRSQALINDDLLVNFPADTYMHFLNYNLPLSKIKNCIITHSHMDHLYPEDIFMRKRHYSHIDKRVPMVFHSDEAGYKIIRNVIEGRGLEEDEIQVELIKPNKPFETDGYKITPLRASHDLGASPVVYLIEKDGKTLFYSNDTGEYPKETMEYLKTIKKPCALISFDCTEACSSTTYEGHLTFERCIKLRETLLDMGVADDKTIFVLNHFSHNGKNVLYDEFVKIAAEKNFEVAYDGMIIEF